MRLKCIILITETKSFFTGTETIMTTVTEVIQMTDTLTTSDLTTVSKIHAIPVSRDNPASTLMTSTSDSKNPIADMRGCLWFKTIRLLTIHSDRSKEVCSNYKQKILIPGDLLPGRAVIEWVGLGYQEQNAIFWSEFPSQNWHNLASG